MQPFEVIEPAAGESPVVVEVPHAGLAMDAEALAFTIAPARRMGQDADLYVDELMLDAPSEGATLIVARTSRYFVDLNRAETDLDAEAAAGGGQQPWPRGVIWRLTTEGDRILEAPLPKRELERRLDLVYRPYHRAVADAIERKRARFGFAVLLCAHSMPSSGRRADGSGQLIRRADLVPGTRGRTTAAAAVIDRVDDHGRAHGWSVKHDDPYKGGFTTGHYGAPHESVHAVQIEIARRLYMDEASLRIDPSGFRAVRQFGRTLVARLAFAEPDAPRRALDQGTRGRRADAASSARGR